MDNQAQLPNALPPQLYAAKYKNAFQTVDMPNPADYGNMAVDPNMYAITPSGTPWDTLSGMFSKMQYSRDAEEAAKNKAAYDAAAKEAELNKASLEYGFKTADEERKAARGSGASPTPIAYINDKGQPVWGTIAEGRGKVAATYSPELKGQISAFSAGGKTGEELNTKQHVLAASAVPVVKKADTLIEQLNKTGVTTGMGASLILGLNKATALLGGKEAAKNASESEIADVLMGSEVFPLIQSLGIGARGMDTPAEKEFLRKVLTGELGLEKNTLIKMAELRKQAAMDAIKNWDKRVKSGELDKYYQSIGMPKRTYGEEFMTTPTGSDVRSKADAILSGGK